MGMRAVGEWVRRVLAWALRLRVVRSFLLFSESNGGVLAGSITFRALFSLFAAVLLGFSAAAIWLQGRPELWDALVSAMNNVIPGLVGGAGSVIDVRQLQNAPGSITIAGVIAVLGLIWAAIGAIQTTRTAIRMMAGTAHDTASFFVLIVRDLIFAAAMGAMFVVSAAVTFLGSAFASAVLGWLGLGSGLLATLTTRLVTIAVTFVLDAVLIALLFALLSGRKVSARALWSGALIGAVGLVVLQQLSGLFVGGATSNPLLATFSSLVALLLWLNLSAQVILIGCAHVITTADEEQDRVGEKYGAATFAQRKVRRAERDVEIATATLREAREQEAAEREKLAAEGSAAP
ncbi:YihY/virulence factor BrkB family protein [Microbacterium sediminis]|nr:YihY/virulence factor BrkB family protein [Microbacterium sediminis]